MHDQRGGAVRDHRGLEPAAPVEPSESDAGEADEDHRSRHDNRRERHERVGRGKVRETENNGRDDDRRPISGGAADDSRE